MELINHSPYTAGIVVDVDRQGAETLVLMSEGRNHWIEVRTAGSLRVRRLA